MAVFKCKMCGGTLEIKNNETVATCEYCGTQQTLPKLDDERRANLYDRANHFRRNNEFDKALGIYEQILSEDNTDAEAHWSIILCKYGIEYVEDPRTNTRVPTVNRAQFTSIFDDDNYALALKYADGYQEEIYKAEAEVINEIQKGILEISNKEEPFDVFICYKEQDKKGERTQDSVIAQELYYQLEKEGIRTFFARVTLEDKLGVAYEPYIFAALNSAKAMVVLGTKPEHFNAVWVKNEWSRYLALVKKGADKTLIPVYQNMDPYDLPEAFSHLQAQDMAKVGAMQDLVYGIKKILKNVVNVPQKGKTDQTQIKILEDRIFSMLEDGSFGAAKSICNELLIFDPQNVMAYVGKLMIDLKVKTFSEKAFAKKKYLKNENYLKAIEYADDYVNEKFKSIARARKKRKKTQIFLSVAAFILICAGVIASYFIIDNKYNTLVNEMYDTTSDFARLYTEFDKIEWYKDSNAYKATCAVYMGKSELCLDVEKVIYFGSWSDGARASVAELPFCREIIVADGVTHIDEQAFQNLTKITKIVLPESVEFIGYEAFYGCHNLTSINIPEKVRDIKSRTFAHCINLKNIIIPESVKTIEQGAFEDCQSLEEVILPSGINYIPTDAFNGCINLTSINIPERVVKIGARAFKGCTSLKDIIIPESVVKIEYCAFLGCKNLETIKLPENVVISEDRVFYGCDKLKIIR